MRQFGFFTFSGWLNDNMNDKITLMAAVAANGCFGSDNALPWHLPEDFAFFKAYTLGKTVLMGRKTWDSLPRKPLPQRRNIVLSRGAAALAGAECFDGWDAAWAACAGESEVVVIGGAQIYAQALPLATDLRLTEVKLEAAGDAFFPAVDWREWREVAREGKVSAGGVAFDFVHWVRR